MPKIEAAFGIFFMILGLLVVLFAIDYANLNILDSLAMNGIYTGLMWFIIFIIFALGAYVLYGMSMGWLAAGQKYKTGNK